jgi:hypothetical protein
VSPRRGNLSSLHSHYVAPAAREAELRDVNDNTVAEMQQLSANRSKARCFGSICTKYGALPAFESLSALIVHCEMELCSVWYGFTVLMLIRDSKAGALGF